MSLSIRAKVLLTVTLSLVLIFTLTIYLVVTDTTHRLKTSLNQESKSFASLATTPIGNAFELYQNSGTVRIDQQVSNFLSLDPDVTSIRVVSTDGTQLFNSQKQAGTPISAATASTFQPVYQYTSGGYVNQIVQPLIEESGVHRYAIVYEISSKRIEQNIEDVVRLIVGIGLAFLLASVIGTGFLLNRLFIKPLRDLSQSANEISAGDYDHQIVSRQHDEIGNLATSVNKMAESLKADITKLQDLDKLKSEFMMIASHNLRTPISIMSGYLDMSKDIETVNELKTIINTIGESVTRLHLLAEDVLTIATLEAGAAPPRTPTPMKAFLDSIVEEFAPLAQKKQLHWQFTNELPEDLRLSIGQANMRSAFASILDNAIKFTKDGGNVKVAANVQDGKLNFSVADTGIGIAEEEIPKLFTKFHRGTSTLTYDYEGEGLGLYLSKLIINQHGGQISINSRLHEGTTCTVSLPLDTLSGPVS